MPRDLPPDPDDVAAQAFPDAREVHESILADPSAYPDGWVEQARFRERYDLPPFRPPEFSDGERVRNVVSAIESTHGIDVTFVVRNLDDGWTVEIDGKYAFVVDRYRNDAANTVIALESEVFRARVEQITEG